MSGRHTVDIAAVIDGTPLTKWQVYIILLCALALAADGVDVASIGYVAPALAQQWGLPNAAFGPVFGAGLFGLTIGAFVFGPIADRTGRRTVAIVSVTIFAVFTLATPLAASGIPS